MSMQAGIGAMAVCEASRQEEQLGEKQSLKPQHKSQENWQRLWYRAAPALHCSKRAATPRKQVMVLLRNP